MLTFLSIRDVVLIERLDLAFEPGLSVLTGETGAGKSILLDSLSLVLGARADGALIRTGASKLSVSAEFSIPPDHPAHGVLNEADLSGEPGDPLIVRREISADGRSKAYVNDRPASVGLLKRLGGELVEIHGQFESHGLLDPANHCPVLDKFSPKTSAALTATKTAFDLWHGAVKARLEAEELVLKARTEESYLRATLDELDALSPQVGEEGRLAEDRGMLMNSEKLAEGLNDALAALAEPVDISLSLRQAQRALERIALMAGGKVAPVLEGFERATVELADAREGLETLTQHLDLEPKRLEKVEERLFTLRGLARKHNCHPDNLPLLRDETRAALMSLDEGGDRLAQLLKDETAARETYLKAATALSRARTDAAKALDAAVNGELAPLKLEKARFKTGLDRLAEAQWGPRGLDKVTFLVATNPGADPAPIHKIASGGELARFMLALKVVLASDADVPTLVFDEVDAGIGGATAAAVGDRLARLGSGVQVLVVTHSPQVAAKGRHHYRVTKVDRAKGLPGTEVTALSDGDRLEEVARMLSGSAITPEARAAARVLMETTP